MDECEPLPDGGANSAKRIDDDNDPVGVLSNAAGRGLHSSTFQLNVSTLCGIRGRCQSVSDKHSPG